MSNYLMNMFSGAKKLVEEGKSNANCTDAQWNAYVNICKMKATPVGDRNTFTVASMSEAIKTLGALPNRYKATPAQIAKFNMLCIQLNVTPPDVSALSGNELSEKIGKLMKLVPPTPNQLQRLINFYRFGLIPSYEGFNSASASDIIKAMDSEYALIHDNRSTLGQCIKIMELQLKVAGIRLPYADSEDVATRTLQRLAFVLEHKDLTSNLIELSAYTFEGASDMIAKLKEETDNIVEVLKSNTPSSEKEDATSRSMESDEWQKLSFEARDFEVKKKLYVSLQALLGQSTRSDSELEQLKDTTIDVELQNLMMLAVEIAGEKATFAVVASCESVNTNTKETVDDKKVAREEKNRKAREARLAKKNANK